MQVDLEAPAEPTEVGLLAAPEVSLLAGPSRLWVLAKDETWYLENGVLQPAPHGTELAEYSPPFVYEDRPAVLERWPTTLALATYGEGGWQRGPHLDLIGPASDCGCAFDWARAVADDRGVHVFIELGSTLYHTLWNPVIPAGVTWDLVGDAGDSWWPVLDEGTAVVFTRRSDNANEIIGLRQDDNDWSEFVHIDDALAQSISAFPMSGPEQYAVLSGTGYGREMVLTVIQGDDVVVEKTVGGSPNRPVREPDNRFQHTVIVTMAVQYSATFLLPVLLAVILSALMRRHRFATIQTSDREASHASLTRRAIAQLIDALALAAPAVAGAWFASSAFWALDFYAAEGFWESTASILPALVGLGVSIVGFFVFAYTEGRWGLTPGKAVTRIRVLGTDLQPCGTGRALVRNLLKVIDGFFNFMVGIMVVALSENWQRVGDMAARTVVVNARRKTVDT
jgi:uncharacterized RDD family membrane protein YckC